MTSKRVRRKGVSRLFDLGSHNGWTVEENARENSTERQDLLRNGSFPFPPRFASDLSYLRKQWQSIPWSLADGILFSHYEPEISKAGNLEPLDLQTWRHTELLTCKTPKTPNDEVSEPPTLHLQRICKHIVEHIAETSSGKSLISRMVLHFKVDVKNKVRASNWSNIQVQTLSCSLRLPYANSHMHISEFWAVDVSPRVMTLACDMHYQLCRF